MPRDAVVLQIKGELCHPKWARKVSGLLRNARLVGISLTSWTLSCTPFLIGLQFPRLIFWCLIYFCFFLFLFEVANYVISLTKLWWWAVNESAPSLKIFFSVECSLALSKHIAPFSFFDQMLTFHNLENLGKTNHHLFHDRVRRGVGLFLIWRHQLLCILNARKSVCDVNQEWTHAPFWLGRETNGGKYHLRDKKAMHS